MIGIEGQPILTAARMKAAELASGVDLCTLMERAGRGVAEAVRRLAAGAEALILCGPGANGGDGYVAARVLRENGHPVRVAALAEPTTELARRARQGWTGPVEPLLELRAEWGGFAHVVVDCVFGTGLSRALQADIAEQIANVMFFARLSIAVDLPSGVNADTGALLAPAGSCPRANLTLALGALKPAHVLMPAADQCGDVRLLNIGLNADARSDEAHDRCFWPPSLRSPTAYDHKYSRGMVVVVGGVMSGAAALAVTAAIRAGAGYGLMLNEAPCADLPHAVVQRRWSATALADAVRGKPDAVIVIGPGLGRDDGARAKLDAALAGERALVIDGDALHLLDDNDFALFRTRPAVVLTPHAGEFAALFGNPECSKIEAARAAAKRAGAVVVFKGPNTVVAYPDGHTSTHAGSSPWLSTAGTGDVLAGTIAGLWQASSSPVEDGVWLHAEAARRWGASFIADDLAHALTAARASL